MEGLTLGSFVVYSGFVLALFGLLGTARPIRRLRLRTRWQGLALLVAGVLLSAIGASLPARESRVDTVRTRLDGLVPAWQFREVHRVRTSASPQRAYEAMKQVRADEILLFRTLTWIRRGGRDAPESILNAGKTDPLIEVALRHGFVLLAEEAPRELVIGTVVVAPPGARGSLTPAAFRQPLPAGFALAAMNFVVEPDGQGGSVVSTETRVFANSDAARRRFARYWRVIYPGSALIRRMWLRAIRQRAQSVMPP